MANSRRKFPASSVGSLTASTTTGSGHFHTAAIMTEQPRSKHDLTSVLSAALQLTDLRSFVQSSERVSYAIKRWMRQVVHKTDKIRESSTEEDCTSCVLGGILNSLLTSCCPNCWNLEGLSHSRHSQIKDVLSKKSDQLPTNFLLAEA